jgi:hypothetical protein
MFALDNSGGMPCHASVRPDGRAIWNTISRRASKSILVGRGKDDRLHVFCVDVSGGLWHCAQASPGRWSLPLIKPPAL